MSIQSPQILAIIRPILVAWFLFSTNPCYLVESKCKFDAIFNFGDSNSDTGGFYAAFPAESSPNGMTYFRKPSGRASDGRLIIDFLAQALGFPFLSPYLQSIGTNYRHGANYATLASTVLLPNSSLFVGGLSPFALPIQLKQMKEFKARVDELHSSGTKESERLPPPDFIGKSIYVLYIGQNDVSSNLPAVDITVRKQYLGKVVSQIAGTIKELYRLGGRTFLVLNMAPVGCYPSFLVEVAHNKTDLDALGCLIPYNNVVNEYNSMLKETLNETRQSLPKASLIYVDTHSILLELFQHPTSHGFRYGSRACCGYGGGQYNFDPRAYCANSGVINGRSVRGTACDDPQSYVSWDGIHATDAANKIVTRAILSGSYFDPPFPLHQLCDLQPIG